MNDDDLADQIEVELERAWWRLSMQTSTAAERGVNAIRSLLDYAAEIEPDSAVCGRDLATQIRRRIAVALGILDGA